ncbi:hypothetical protein JT359_00960 [Candidatus Poribacteria bacterium]|nr:hypothetical protein [Candidatus Poribacteria bacterium]
MKRHPLNNQIFFLGLIGSLVLIIGIYFFVKSEAGNPYINSLPENITTIQSQQNKNTATKNRKHSILHDETVTDIEGDEVGTNIEGTTIPKLSQKVLWATMMYWHQGPQTVEALMESYHVAYLQNERHRRIDKIYPPEQWLQKVLDAGYTILNYVEYVQYLDIRDSQNQLEVPGVRKLYSETFGIPETEIDRLKALYVKNQFLLQDRKNAVERATTEPIAGGFFAGNKFLPFYRDRAVVYVQRDENKFSAKFLGSSLNNVQRFLLLFLGIEPKNIEVIYIDKMGNQLSK